MSEYNLTLDIFRTSIQTTLDDLYNQGDLSEDLYIKILRGISTQMAKHEKETE